MLNDHETQIETVECGGAFNEEDSKMEMVAKLACKRLTEHYPDHIWMVGWAPGAVLVIKNMAILDGRYGFTVDAARAATVSELEKAIVMGGGELLERCGVRRGRWDGEMMTLQDTGIKSLPGGKV